MKKVGNEPRKGYILFGGSSGDRFMCRIVRKEIFPCLFESNVEILGVD